MASPVLAALARAKQAEQDKVETAAAYIVNTRLGLLPRRGNRDEWPVFETWAKSEDARFNASVGPRSPEFSEELIAYAGELGISHEALVHLFKTENVLRSAPFQHVIHTAVQARLAQKKAANWKSKAAKPVPTVQRPGTSQPRGAAASENLNTLSNNLSRTGSLKDAAALLLNRRKAAR